MVEGYIWEGEYLKFWGNFGFLRPNYNPRQGRLYADRFSNILGRVSGKERG